jgi:hypothetical protein
MDHDPFSRSRRVIPIVLNDDETPRDCAIRPTPKPDQADKNHLRGDMEEGPEKPHRPDYNILLGQGVKRYKIVFDMAGAVL